MTEGNNSSADASTRLGLGRRVYLQLFEPTFGELRPYAKWLTSISLVMASLGLIFFLKNRELNGHFIDYAVITLADITAGSLLFMILEHRVAGREARFADERNLRFAANRVILAMGELSKLSAEQKAGHFDLNRALALRDDMRIMLNDPEQWRFFGSEMLHTSLGNALRSGANDISKFASVARNVFTHAVNVSAMSLEHRMRISKVALVGQEKVAKDVQKALGLNKGLT